MVTAILATWLGLLVATRAGGARGASVFVFLCTLLVLWSVAIVVQRTTGDASLLDPINVFEDVAAWLLPAATVHIALVIAFEGRYSRLALTVLAAAYLVGAIGIVQAVTDPAHPIAFDEPNFEPFGLDGIGVAWLFTAVRAAVFASAIGYLVSGLRSARTDLARRRQLLVAVVTVTLGVVGGMARIVPPEVGGPRWVGVTMVAAAVVLATYAVVAQHLFLASEVAARAVRWSLFAGIGVMAYVVSILALDAVVGRALATELPIITALAIVVTIAVFEPVAGFVRARLLEPSTADPNERRLLVAIGADPLLAQAPDRALGPALERVVRTFDLEGAAVVGADGRVVTSAGRFHPERPLGLRMALDEGGHAVFVPGLDRSFTATEVEALRLAAAYLGSSLRLAERHEAGVSAISALRAERAAVESSGTALRAALAQAAAVDRDALRVWAMGPLRAERDGDAVRRWGGEKAGSRQAEAIFALLFDRGERGASKDEILEIVWPDVDLDRADVAFHRTMLGLRATLRPGRRASRAREPIVFANDRYRLDPSIVSWSDLAEFERLVRSSREQPDRAMEALEQARALYRGDYLDDVPYLGDSAAVEERREELRETLRDVLIELAARYAQRGDRVAAAACERQAAVLSGEAEPLPTSAVRASQLT